MSVRPLPIDQAVVLLGRREVRKGGPPKRILGLTVLERLILSAHMAGVRDFLLVGPDGDPAEEALPSPEKDKRFRKDGLKMERASLPGLPDIVRQGRLKSRFWLLDGDAVFDPAILAEAGPDDPLPLRSVAPGIRICSPETLPQAAAAEGPANPGVAGRFSIRVRSREDEKAAERYILATGRRPHDGVLAKYIIRPVSLWITKHLLKLGVTPNMMTALSLVVGGLSAWLVARGDRRSAVLAGLAFQFASILDHCDGSNARMTFRVSKLGSAIDVLGDAVVNLVFFSCLSLGLYRTDGRRMWLDLGLFVILSLFLYYISVIRMARAEGRGTVSVASGHLFTFAREIEGKRGHKSLRGVVEMAASKIAYIFRREFFVTAVMLILAFLGAKALMWLIVVLLPVQGIYITLFAEKRFREQRRAGGR